MTTDKPRYSRLSDLIDLATFMSSTPLGITLDDIIERYNVSRRTAERMRDGLMNVFPQVQEIDYADGHKKHWGFVDYSIKEMVHFTPEEIATVEQFQKRTTNGEMKELLEKVTEKIKTLSKKGLENIENNIDLILQTEGYAVRQTIQYHISDEILITIREAMKKCLIVTGKYHDKIRYIEPLGLIYGEKIYLIAREKAKGDEIYTYLLNKFTDLKLTMTNFDRGDFNLDEFSKRSFSAYFGKILNVKLKFDKEIAEDVMTYNFHPSQKIEQKPDGSVIVRFKASGDKSIMWHVFRWGDKVEILAPKELRTEYVNALKSVLKRYKK